MALTLERKYIIATFFIFIMACTTCRATSRSSTQDTEPSIATRHEEWMGKHGRVYADSAEKTKRQQIFKENLEFIEKHNKEGNNKRSYNLSLNRFADLTNEEFVASHTGALYKPPTHHPKINHSSLGYNHKMSDADDIEPSLDWRQKGAVNDIKNQHKCGSCWAFAAAAAVEGINQIKNGELVSLSEQQLVDCASYDGCHGQFVEKAFEYIHQNGIASEAEYPYVGAGGTCSGGGSNSNSAIYISGYHSVTPQSEEELLAAVATQPVAVLLEAMGQAFQFYNGGVFSGQCGTQLNHAVTVIGYGEEAEGKYWLLRNSWGQGWGEGGYMKIKRGTGDPQGLCGINMQASYPII